MVCPGAGPRLLVWAGEGMGGGSGLSIPPGFLFLGLGGGLWSAQAWEFWFGLVELGRGLSLTVFSRRRPRLFGLGWAIGGALVCRVSRHGPFPGLFVWIRGGEGSLTVFSQARDKDFWSGQGSRPEI